MVELSTSLHDPIFHPVIPPHLTKRSHFERIGFLYLVLRVNSWMQRRQARRTMQLLFKAVYQVTKKSI